MNRFSAVVRRRLCLLLVLLTCGLCSAQAWGQASPAVERLIPSGGQSGTTVTVRPAGSVGDGDIRWVTDSGQLTFALSEKRDTVDISIDPAARPGVHWVRVCNAVGATEWKPFLVGIVPEISETEPNARLSEAIVLPGPSVTANGVLEKANDVDTYSVSLTRGQTLVASLLANRILNSPMDAVLQVVDRRGTVVAQNDDDCSFDPLVTFTAPEDGLWFVRVFAFPAAPNSTIGFAGGADYVYRLTMTAEGFVHHTVPLVRQVGSGEQRFQLRGWNLSVQESVLGPGESTLAGQFAVPWTVHETEEPVNTEPESDGPQRLTVPVARSGRIRSAAAEDFVVSAMKGQSLQIRAEVQRFGSLLDPVLTVLDSAGKVIREADDIDGENPDAQLDFTAPEDGEYTIRVRDRYLAHGERCFYLLRCVEIRPEVFASVKSTAWVVAADKPLEIAVTVDRRHGFAEVLSFRVEGLPEGLSAECPVSAKDGDSSKAVTLRISGTVSQSWSGEFRIVAETDQSRRVVPVTWTAPDRTTKTGFWLTVPAGGG